AVVTGGRGQIPSAGDGLRERVAAARDEVREGPRVRERRVGIVVEREARRAEAAARAEGEIGRASWRGGAERGEGAAFSEREGTGDGRPGGNILSRDRAAVVAGGRGQVPSGRHRLRERVAAPGHDVGEGPRVRERRVGIVVEREARRAEAAARAEG